MTATDPQLSPALIIGTGLIGASIGCALVKAGVKVHLRDLVPGHVQVAASRGAGTIEEPEPQQVEMVIVAVPPDAVAQQVLTALRDFPNATVTDVSSVKGTVLQELRAAGVDLSRYVGSHPMAGSQLSGPLTAKAELFSERTWIVTPHDTSAAHAVLAVNELVETCGARRMILSAAHHDEAVAQVSHLPQIVSALMAGTLNRVPPEHLSLAGQGVQDVTRIAASDPSLWEQIIGANQVAVARELTALAADLNELVDKFADPGALVAFLSRGQQGRGALPGKHGLAPTQFAQVIVEIPDTPGAFAKLFADAQAAQVNVEDISIVHDQNRQVGYLSLHVDPARAQSLRAAMSTAGWTLREGDQERLWD
ncbi:MAG: prephenate dehydrogenase [Propionibacteriaceae bacterium]|nr:prephenate dehydrogenase [Propionibacteriaceae bacterium]